MTITYTPIQSHSPSHLLSLLAKIKCIYLYKNENMVHKVLRGKTIFYFSFIYSKQKKIPEIALQGV